MKSRLAVSLLFILVASTSTPDATGAFRKLRSWAGNVCAAHVCRRSARCDSVPTSVIRSGDQERDMMLRLDGEWLPLMKPWSSEPLTRAPGTISSDGNSVTFDSSKATARRSSLEGRTQGVFCKLGGFEYPGEALEFMTTAGQIREVLSLMRSK